MVTVLKPFWLAHPHWVREAEAEGRGQWEPAPLSELPPELAQAVAAEIAAIAKAYGGDRAPMLWRAVGG
jgi:hypothetical protein